MKHKLIIELLERGGVVAASDWVTGSKRFVSSRPIPTLCEKFEVKDAKYFPLAKPVSEALESLLAERPNVKKVVAVTDDRKAELLIPITNAIKSLRFAVLALQAPEKSVMRQNLSDLEALCVQIIEGE
jgi:hypothetical protein